MARRNVDDQASDPALARGLKFSGKQLVNSAASGDASAMRLLLALIQASEAKPGQTASGAPSAGDALVMREIARRLKGEAP